MNKQDTQELSPESSPKGPPRMRELQKLNVPSVEKQSVFLSDAMLALAEQDYNTAAKLFGKIVKHGDQSPKMVNDICFRKVICHLADDDMHNAEASLQVFSDAKLFIDKDSEFLTAIIHTVKEHDSDAFTDAVIEKVDELDGMLIRALQQVKKSIKNATLEKEKDTLPESIARVHAINNTTHLEENTREFERLSQELLKELKNKKAREDKVEDGISVGAIVLGSTMLWLLPNFITGLILGGNLSNVVIDWNNKKGVVAYILRVLAAAGAGAAAVYMWDIPFATAGFYTGMGVIAGISCAQGMDNEKSD